MKKSLLYHLGTFFIVFSILSTILLIGFTYYPLLVPAPAIKQITDTEGFYITIPKIKAQAKVIANVDPWNEEVYQDELKKGVGHAKGTGLPGDDKTMFLFAHSSLPPWEMTRVNTPFLKLTQLENNDSIEIIKDGKRYLYKVREKKEVWPNEIRYLTDTTRNQLILQTCVPIGTTLKRLLVFADPI